MHSHALVILASLVALGDRNSLPIQPYLQWPHQDAITVMWETEEEEVGKIRYGPTPDLDLAAVEAEPRLVHEVRLTGLLPATRYFYRVRSGSGWTELSSFRTEPSRGDRWRMVVYGDSRSFPERHSRIAELASQFNPNLVVHTGDQVTRGTQRPQWKSEFFDPAASLWSRVPVVTSLGNHEENAGNYFEYFSLPGNERYFSLNYANVHLVILDSNSWGPSPRNSEQFQWLEQDLATDRSNQWTLVAFHHPLFSAHDRRPINAARWDWCPAFEAWGVDLVLTGHDHFYYRSRPIGHLGETPSRGVVHITTAGGGAPLYKLKSRSYTTVAESTHHITVLDFVGDEIHGQAVDLDGKVVDQYTIKKSPSLPQEFCAYEVFDLERSIRLEMESRAPAIVPADWRSMMIEDEIRVPHQFRVPVKGRVSWSDSVTEDAASLVDVELTPGQPCVIPYRRSVALDPILGGPGPRQLPSLRLIFEDERFCNRRIEFCPLKLWREIRVHSHRIASPDQLATIWEEATNRGQKAGLVASDGIGQPAVPGEVVALHSRDWLAVVTTIKDASAASLNGPKEAEVHDDPETLIKGNHLRLLISDGQQTYSFVVSPDGKRADSRDGIWSFDEPDWRATTQGSGDQWGAAFLIPRRLVSGDRLRINLVHADPAQEIEDCLSPTFDPGNDPDRIPHFKFGPQTVARFATLILN